MRAKALEIEAKCDDGKWWPLSKIGRAVNAPDSYVRGALKILGPDRVETQPDGIAIIYRLKPENDASLRIRLVAKDQEIAGLKARIAEQAVEINELKEMLGVAPSPEPSAAPSSDTVH